MAKYTISIMEALQHNATGSLSDPEVLLQAAMASIFSDGELDPISEEYRDFFALCFARHYLIDEIGVETWALWKIMLAGRIFENAAIINELLANQDKQLYASYQVHIGDASTSTKDSNTATTTDSSEDTSEATHNSTSSSNGTDDTSYLGSHINKRTGDDTTLMSGSEVHDRTGNDTVTKAGSEITNFGRTETAGQFDTVAFSATPQGPLQDVDNGTYLTNYTKNSTGGTNSSGGKDSLSFENRADTTQYGSKDTTSYQGRNDRTTYNTTDTETFDGRKDQTTHANTDTSEGSDDTTTTHSGESTTSSNGKSDTESATNDVTYSFLLEKFAGGNVIMDRIWSLFTTLFMGIA